MGGISKRRSHIEVEMHLSSRFKLFFLGVSSQQPKKNMSEQCLVFPIFQPTFWFTQDLYTVCLGLSYHRFTITILRFGGNRHQEKTAASGAGFDPAKTIPVMIDVGCSDANGNSAKSGSQQITDAGGFCCFFFVCACDA